MVTPQFLKRGVTIILFKLPLEKSSFCLSQVQHSADAQSPRKRYLLGMEPRPLRIIVIESHPLMREALCDAIASEPDLKLLAGVPDRVEALDTAIVLNPDVILLSLGNPGPGDLDTLTALRRALPNTIIMALITAETPGQEEAALKAGASNVLTKSASRTELVRTLRAIQADGLSTRNNPEIKFPT